MQRTLRGVLIFAVLAAPAPSGAQDLGNIRREKWLGFHGALNATSYVYGVDGIQPRRVPFSYILSGNATLTIKGLALPFSFQYSEQQRDFRQPFNQFGVSPKYKWVQLHLGYRNLSYGNYTLNGHQFLGAGVDLTPGRFRFSAMYGRFLKAVPEDTAKQPYNYNSQYPYAFYTRYGYAVKLGYGTAANFIDLSYFKGKDDSSSLPSRPEIQRVQPGENAAVGLRTHLTLFRKLVFDLDAGISAYTRDQRADTVNLGEESTLVSFAKGVLTPRLSTNLYYAGDAGLAWREPQWSLGVKYTRILPDYKTMGMYYLQTDVERYTVAPAFNTKKGTFQANASVGIEHDNVEGKKLAQTDRFVGSLNANLNPRPEWGVSVSYSNYGISQRPGLKSLSDTVTLDQVSNSIVATPRYTLQRPGAVHTFVYVFSNQTLNDRNKFNSENYNMTTLNNTLSYVLYLNRSGVGIDVSAYHVNTKIAPGTTTSVGGSLGANRAFLRNRLNSSISATYSANAFEGVHDGSTLQLRTGHQILASRQHRFRIDGVLTKNESASGALNQSFTEYLLTLGYTFVF